MRERDERHWAQAAAALGLSAEHFAEIRPSLRPLELPPERPPLHGWRRLWAWFSALVIDFAVFRTFFNPRKRIAPDVYRSSHPMPYQMRDAARAGIRSVLSLRGSHAGVGSNQLEWDTCRRLGIPLLHMPIGLRDAPRRSEMLALIEILSRIEKPLLLHCKSGADRAGLASAIYLLTHSDEPVDSAIRQLCFWPHGHIRQAETGVLDAFLEMYRDHHRVHGTGFADWVRDVYDRDVLVSSFKSSRWANRIVDLVLRRE